MAVGDAEGAVVGSVVGLGRLVSAALGATDGSGAAELGLGDGVALVDSIGMDDPSTATDAAGDEHPTAAHNRPVIVIVRTIGW
jgi:hypothetical protein